MGALGVIILYILHKTERLFSMIFLMRPSLLAVKPLPIVHLLEKALAQIKAHLLEKALKLVKVHLLQKAL